MSTIEQQIKELPREISCIIQEYLQHSHRVLFDRVMTVIHTMVFENSDCGIMVADLPFKTKSVKHMRTVTIFYC